MKKLSYISSIIVALLFVGCYDSDLETTEEVASYKSFNATIADMGITRSHLENGREVAWDYGDRIGIYSDIQDVEEYYYTGSTFQGAGMKGNKFYAFYPYTEGAVDKENHNMIHVNLWGGTAYKKDSYYRALPMVSLSDDNNLRFKQTCGIIRFSLSGTSILERIRLEANNFEMLSGDGIIDITADEPVLKMVKDDSDEWRSSIDFWTYSLQLQEDTPTDFYFIVPVGVYEKGITLYIYGKNAGTNEEFTLIKKTDKRVDVKRAMIKSFAGFDTDGMLQEMADALLKERQALMDFYNATDGDHWRHNDNWGSDKPVDDWYGVYTYNGRVWQIDLPRNNLAGSIPESMGNLTSIEYLFLNDNQLTGTIPDSFVNLTKLEDLVIYNNRMDGTLSEALLTSDWWKNRDINLKQQEGFRLKYGYLYESADFSQDGKVEILQRHRKGNGIKIVITGEAFSDRLIEDGTFMDAVNWAMEAFFAVEPYTSFRDYFDVYAVTAVSKNEVIDEDVVFETKNGGSNKSYTTNYEKIAEYVLKVPELKGDRSDVLSIVLLNGGNSRAHCTWYSDGFAIALAEIGEDETLHHEAGGHGFVKLADEYTNDDVAGGTAYTENLTAYHNLGWYLNVDTTSDPSRVLWRDFIANHDYDIEKIGIYEGAIARYSRGIYRATENSIMRYNTGGFNAPSRWAIYKHMMELAGESYTFNDFLAYDQKNLERIAGTRSYVEKSAANVDVSKLGAPPVIHDYPSSEMGDH